MTHAEARERVSKGAALLDQKRPGWFNEIDTGRLTLSDGCGCVLGQLAEGKYLLGMALAGLQKGMSEDADYGFELTNSERQIALETGGVDAPYRILQDFWISEIASRLFPEETHVHNLILTKEVIHEGL